jgi:acyl-CoA synthetase
MSIKRTPLTAADIVAPPVAADRLEEYRRFGYVSDLTMSASVVRAARQWGSQPAIFDGGHQLTYQELLELVERASAWLAEASVGPGDVVCWQTPNWWEAHVLGLAVWHIGAVSCPIAPFYREHELRQVIEQVRPAW